MKTVISTTNAPAAIGPYSQAIRVGNLIFTSGQIPIDPTTGSFAEGGIKEQMYVARTGYRQEENAELARLREENVALRQRIEQLEAYITQLINPSDPSDPSDPNTPNNPTTPKNY